MLKFLIVFFACLLCNFAHPSKAALAESEALHQKASGADAPAASLLKLNAEFRALYRNAKGELEPRLEPLIVVLPNRLVLHYKGKRIEEAYAPPNYSLLKVVDHVPLVLFVYLNSRTDKELSSDAILELKKIRDLVTDVRPTLSLSGLPPAILQRQNEILNRSIKFIDDTSSRKSVSTQQLDVFTKGLGPMALENGYDAVSLELSTLDKIVRKWKSELPAEDWGKLRVVITGPHMPRLQERSFLYFSRLLKENEEGHRLIYMEGSDDEEKGVFAELCG